MLQGYLAVSLWLSSNVNDACGLDEIATQLQPEDVFYVPILKWEDKLLGTT